MKVEQVERFQADMKLKRDTTVWALRQILNAAGHDTTDKACFVQQNGAAYWKTAADKYVILKGDHVVFDIVKPSGEVKGINTTIRVGQTYFDYIDGKLVNVHN